MQDAPIRILLVEDEPDHVYLVRRAFDSCSMPVDLSTASSLAESRKCMAESTPDLLITDLFLNDGKGVDLLPAGAEDPPFATIVITGYGDETTAVEAMKAGALDYIVKSPSAFSDMPRIAMRALQQWRHLNEASGVRKRYEYLVEQERDVLFTIDLDGRITFVNRAVQKLLDYHAEEIIDTNFRGYIHEDYREKTDRDFARLLQCGSISGETVLVDKNKRSRTAEYSMTVIEDNGRQMGVRGIVRDITKRRQVEEELTRHRQNLEQQVQARTEELAKINQQLREKIEERKRLEDTLRYRSDFENLVAALSTHFINLHPDQVDLGIKHALEVIGDFVGADRSYVFQLSADDDSFENTYEWSKVGIDARSNQFQKIPLDRLPWWSGNDHVFEIVHIPCVSRPAADNVPAEKYLPSRSSKSLIAVPLTCRNRLTGFVGFDSVTVEKAWSLGHVSLLKIVGELFANVLDRQQTDQELQREKQYLRELLDLQERERKLVAYEIHDGLAQKLAGALLRLQSISPVPDGPFKKNYDLFQSGLDLLAQSMDETRRLISGLRPPILDESGIVAAVDYLVCEQLQQFNTEIVFKHRLSCDRLAPLLETALFRIIQEALTNACRHSRTKKICVSLNEEKSRIRLIVQDWGIGFDPKNVPCDRYGLRGINERVRLLGGQVNIESLPDRGTCITVVLPFIQSLQ